MTCTYQTGASYRQAGRRLGSTELVEAYEHPLVLSSYRSLLFPDSVQEKRVTKGQLLAAYPNHAVADHVLRGMVDKAAQWLTLSSKTGQHLPFPKTPPWMGGFLSCPELLHPWALYRVLNRSRLYTSLVAETQQLSPARPDPPAPPIEAPAFTTLQFATGTADVAVHVS
jgi:hypothetical protein